MNHLSRIAAKLPEYDLDAMLIVSDAGERYALGFHGEGLLLVARDSVHYSTDGRYIEDAQQKIQGVNIGLIGGGRGHIQLAQEYLKAHPEIRRIGFESGSISVDDHQRYADSLPGQLIPAQKLLNGLRAAKDADEIAAMERAQAITDEAFTAILSFIHPGLTEQEVAARLVYEMLRRGAEKVSFDPIVAAGPNGSKPHAIPGSTVIEQGMFITMDFGCMWGGYCSDMTRTVAIGQPTEEMERVYNTVLQAQKAGIAAARAGVSGRAIDEAARRVIAQAGYGEYFNHSFGHSLGLEIHEAPNASPTDTTPMPVGAAISAEPGIYLPGKFGVRIEDVLILSDDGCRDITRSRKDLIVL
ncbi:MAG: aminopeptidase P family protein [Clostridium sp.]|nr:aminopeptidase P family protein [Clostridium sp.]